MYSDLIKLESLLEHLREVERRIPDSDERAVLEVARLALDAEVRQLAHRLEAQNYWRPRRAG